MSFFKERGAYRHTFMIPFMGMYESMIDANLNDEMMRDDEDGSAVDWPATHLRIARDYAETWLFKLGLTGDFVKMISPREYEFETDQLIVTVDHNTRLTEFAGVARNRDFANWVAANYSTRSGFIKPVIEWGDDLDSKGYALIFQYLELTEWPELAGHIIEELQSNDGFSLVMKE